MIKVFLIDKTGHSEAFCGPGMIRLLDEINLTRNVRKASANIGLSYSKAWKLLRLAEECAGFPLIERRQGGAGGGSATLSEKGIRFLEKYHALFEKCQASVEQIFAEIWTE
ncbi:MAG: LysR family transcriptional regulator [Spirochaetaceae bacterium]|jgi:molybdate transport system regulatory protein|nr:LysR family transcriptional regulator [Spirochaetaceae bacterium]